MKKKLSRRKFLKHCLKYGCLGIAASYPVFIERYVVLVNTYKIPVPNLPTEFRGFRIVHLTDVHYGPLTPASFIRRVFEKANSIGADIIVCTGDYILENNGGDSSALIDTVWRMLGKLRAKSGVCSVLGNHDHWGSFARSMSWMRKTGQDVRHKAVPIERNGKRIWIGGAGDYLEDNLGIDKAFKNVPENESKILLAHNPDSADSKFDTKIDLMISGHTHGGQVALPFLGAPVLPVSNKKYSSGFIRSANTNLFISKGIGWAIFPVRFNCFPEIAILELA